MHTSFMILRYIKGVISKGSDYISKGSISKGSYIKGVIYQRGQIKLKTQKWHD